jgi:glycosidase
VLRDVLLHHAPAGRIADVLRHDSLYLHPELLVSFFANHDVPRFASENGASPATEKLAFGLTLTLRGIPEIYYGDEVGMPGGGDPDNRRDFLGGWIGDKQDAFTATGRTPEQQQIFSYVQSLLKLRWEHSALRGGSLWHLAADEASYVFLRESEDEHLVVVFNNSEQVRELRVPINDTPAQTTSQVALLFGEAKAELARGEIRIAAPAQSLSVFELR